MTQVTLPTLSSRLLATSSTLSPCACCPTRDLAALASTEDKLSLYRTTGSAHLVWEWTPPLPVPPPSPVSAPPAAAGGGLAARRAMLAKPKLAAAAAPAEIQQVAWSPNGNHLAVGTRSTSSTTSPPPTHSLSLHLLSLHSGTSPLPPILLPPSSSSSSSSARPPAITHLSWQPLHHPTDPLLSSRTTSIIASLPPLPPLASSGSGSGSATSTAGVAAAAAGAGAGGGGGGLTHGQGGVFGAKNAMLQREREKEMGRPVKLEVASPGFPTLLPAFEGTAGVGKKQEEEEEEPSLLLVGTNTGDLHLYLSGSLHLCSLPLSSPILSITLLPTTPPQLSILLSPLESHTLSLPLPPSLHLLAQSATSLRFHLDYAIQALQDARGVWEESRRIGKAWLARLGELSSGHGVLQPPTTQLLHLLLTGRPTRALHDFLASKMNERALTKWENTTASALERLKEVGWSRVQVAVERCVLRLEEVRGWKEWSKFSPHHHSLSTAPPWIPQSLALASAVIRSSASMEREVLEEQRCFVAFQGWVRYELEKVALLEGSELRPLAKFQPLPVAHYITHCLTPGASSIIPYLEFGPLHASLEGLREWEEARGWLEWLGGREEGVGEGEKEGLEGLLRRMKEELKGQADAEWLASTTTTNSSSKRRQPRPPSAPFTSSSSSSSSALDPTLPIPSPAAPTPTPTAAAATDRTIDPSHPERPGRSSTSSSHAPEGMIAEPRSLPILLHLLAQKVGEGLSRAMRNQGEMGSEVVVLGGEGGVEMVRGRAVGEGELWEGWVEGGVLWMVRSGGGGEGQREKGGMKLRLEGEGEGDGDQVEVLQWDFFDDEEVMLAVKIGRKEGPSYALLAIPLASFSFSPLSSSSSPTPLPHLLPSRLHPFDPHYPPQGLALNGRQGRRIVCVLSGEGRKLEVLDAEVEEEEEEEEGDVSMNG